MSYKIIMQIVSIIVLGKLWNLRLVSAFPSLKEKLLSGDSNSEILLEARLQQESWGKTGVQREMSLSSLIFNSWIQWNLEVEDSQADN